MMSYEDFLRDLAARKARNPRFWADVEIPSKFQYEAEKAAEVEMRAEPPKEAKFTPIAHDLKASVADHDDGEIVEDEGWDGGEPNE